MHSLKSRSLRSLVPLVLIPMLAGCMFQTDRPDLGIEIPPAYRTTGNRPHATLPALDWWRGFRSRELTGLVEEAENNNFDIAAAIARITQADALSRIAGAALLPNANADGGLSQTRSSTAGDSSAGRAGSSSPVRNNFETGLSASYEIDFWGKNRATLRAAEYTAIATRFDREVVKLSTIAAVANSYFQVLAAQDRLRIARDNIAAAQRVLDLIRQRVEAGTATGLDTAQQESLLASQRATVPQLQQVLEQYRATLAVLVGRAPEFVKVRGGSMSALAIPRITPGLPSELLQQRPDIAAAEADLRAADANIEAARAAFPSIQLTAQGGFQSAALMTLFGPGAATYAIAASLVQPIFDGGRLWGNLEQAGGRQIELLQIYRKTIVQGFADVDIALTAVRNSAERERLQRIAVDSARRAFSLAEQRLREGTIDLVTVLQTQQSLFQAQDALAQARLARLQSVVSLYQALGGGWLLQRNGRT